ncbi:MAG: hypothetical protein LBH62_05290 [Nitrososphaerota archaeon]|nr:hypothetical protein [Nitrososphaerota archaeon]
MSVMFDIEGLIGKLNIEKTKADAIIAEVNSEYSDDKMLAEIHIIRALKNYARKTKAVVS